MLIRFCSQETLATTAAGRGLLLVTPHEQSQSLMLDALTITFDSYVSRKVFAYKVCVGVDESRQQRKRGVVDNLRAAVEGIENVCSLAHGQDFAADRE